MSRLARAVVALLLVILPQIAHTHPGGLNSEGCHNDRKRGDYHCHGAPKPQPQIQNNQSGQTEARPLSFIPSKDEIDHSLQKVKVVGVIDGDTIKVLLNGVETSIRLHGIDAPEIGQDYGQKSTEAMKAMTTGRTTKVMIIEKDKYGRSVAMVFVDDSVANEMMIEQGHAWVYSKYCKQSFCPSWVSLQESAKKGKKGLWQGGNPTPPWEWRHGSAGPTAVSSTAYQPQRLVSQPAEEPQGNGVGSYHGNVSSHKFHRQGCKHYNCRDCVATFATKEQATAAGYSPCGICKP